MSQTLRELLHVVAKNVTNYQLLLNQSGSDVLSKAVSLVMKEYPTTAVKIVDSDTLTKEFLLSDHMLYIIVNGDDRPSLDVSVFEQKARMVSFAVLEIQESSFDSNAVTVLLTRSLRDDKDIIRNTYQFDLQ